jgi:hypothetical protein
MGVVRVSGVSEGCGSRKATGGLRVDAADLGTRRGGELEDKGLQRWHVREVRFCDGICFGLAIPQPGIEDRCEGRRLSHVLEIGNLGGDFERTGRTLAGR